MCVLFLVAIMYAQGVEKGITDLLSESVSKSVIKVGKSLEIEIICDFINTRWLFCIDS